MSPMTGITRIPSDYILNLAQVDKLREVIQGEKNERPQTQTDL